MSEVKRYICDAATTVGEVIVETVRSPYVVLSSDYDALAKVLEGYKQGAKAEADAGDEARAECRRLRAELAKARELLADVRDNHKYAIHWEDLHQVMARVREWLERNP